MRTSATSETVSRSPSDVLRLVVGVVLVLALLLVEWLFGDTLVTFASDLLARFSRHPQVDRQRRSRSLGGSSPSRSWCSDCCSRFSAAVGGCSSPSAAAAALGAVLVLLLDGIVDVADGALVTKLSTGLGPATDPLFPSVVGVGVSTAVVTAAAPWLSRGWRRWAWVLVFGLALTRFVASPLSFDSLQALLVGWVAGAAVLVLLGAPLRRPTGGAIAEGLERNGLPIKSLQPASVDARGSTPYFGVGEDGSRYFVKALGEDERSADLLFRLFRYVQRRDLGDERPFSSLRRAVEHEAFLALAARDVGVRTPRLRAVATAEPNAMVLAYDAVDGKSIDGLEPSALTDDVLRAIWQQIAALAPTPHRAPRSPAGEHLPCQRR